MYTWQNTIKIMYIRKFINSEFVRKMKASAKYQVMRHRFPMEMRIKLWALDRFLIEAE